MDVYTAKSQLQKMISYIDSLISDNHRMYNKSKDRWNEIRSLSMQLAQSISGLLKSAAIEDTDNTFDDSDQEMNSVIRSIQAELDDIKKFVNYKDTSPPSTPDVKVPYTAKRAIISMYDEVLRSLSTGSTGFIEADDCARLLYMWFHTRFISCTNDFRYNIRQLSSWIYAFCIGYAESVKFNQSEEFKSAIISWCDKLSDEPVKYAVPYEVYQICSDDSSDHMTLTAVVIWDILMNSGLNRLESQSDEYKVFVTESEIYDICNKHAPNILDEYVDYRSDDSVLQKAKIHRC